MVKNIRTLFARAGALARGYDGSEPAYEAFMAAAVAFERAGGSKPHIDRLLGHASAREQALLYGGDLAAFLDRLREAGADVAHHGTVFVRPDQQPEIQDGDEKAFEPSPYEPRLQNVIAALRTAEIYFDDLVLDVGRVRPNQMRKEPYIIITIPRLNAQIAVANQKDEAMFVSVPAMNLMDWAVFEKAQAEDQDGPFAHITRIIHQGAWQERMLHTLFGGKPVRRPKVVLPARPAETGKRLLSPFLVGQIARLARAAHPKKYWPSKNGGAIDPAILLAVSGDPAWTQESWGAIDQAARHGYRGMPGNGGLKQTLHDQGCHYDLNAQMMVAMARLYRARHPKRQWPAPHSGIIDHDIVVAVTGDADWQQERWQGFDKCVREGGRGMAGGSTLSKTLEAHGCHYNLDEDKIADMAKLHHERYGEWPSVLKGTIDRDIVSAVTGDALWQDETWRALDQALKEGLRGLAGGSSLALLLDARFPQRLREIRAGRRAAYINTPQ